METNEKGEKSSSNDHQLSNINATDLDEETNTKLRGDAIGETLYSQSFVLKTILQFSDLKWNEQLEEDLCFLWDMTVEKDVCKYLLEVSFPSIACNALEKYSEGRFVEIVVGILANILCSDCSKNITPDEIAIVLRELETDDSAVLIQAIRFINAVAYMFNDLPFITRDVLDKIIFILYNSTNDELLIRALEAISKITVDFKLDKSLLCADLIKSSLTAYKSIIDGSDDFDLDTKEKQSACKYMLEIMNNFCAYVDKHSNDDFVLEFRNCSNMFIKEIVKILDYYSHEENLLPITDEFVFYMSVLRFLLERLNIVYLSDIFIPVAKILYIVSDFKDEVTELFDTVAELVCFLFFRTTPEVLYEDLKSLSKSKGRRILALVRENQHKYEFNLDLQYLSDKFN